MKFDIAVFFENRWETWSFIKIWQN